MVTKEIKRDEYKKVRIKVPTHQVPATTCTINLLLLARTVPPTAI